ncbi:MAG: FAD-dependent oxidoreductase [Streptococcaceae bacterium]|nr:FAD-dependent oxidoreductase [Streptococcaceae bacterium]
MKVIIIGTNHAGIAAANTLLSYPNIEVTMFDRNTNMSFLGCGTAIWVGRQVETTDAMFYAKPEDFEAKGAKIMLETSVNSVDYAAHKIYFTDKAGNEGEADYDKLILATGSRPIIPNIPGNDLDGIHFLKLFQEGQAVDQEMAKASVKRVAVIGAGYIGTEIAEAAQRRGKEVLLFDAAETSLASYYDPEFAKNMDENLVNHGIELHFGELATAFFGDENGRISGLKTDKATYQVDLIINCIGFTANNPLGGEHLKTWKNGAILIDKHGQTSDPDVYAAGDCATIYSGALRDTTYIALASNAVRTGIVAAHNVAGTSLEGIGVQGSNGIQIYGYSMVSTGLSVKAAEVAGMEVLYTDYEDYQLGGFMPDNELAKIRIVYEKESRRIVGAQMASKMNIIGGNINMFSLAIQEGVTIDKFALTDLFFMPHFNQPYNYMTMAALSAK